MSVPISCDVAVMAAAAVVAGAVHLLPITPYRRRSFVGAPYALDDNVQIVLSALLTYTLWQGRHSTIRFKFATLEVSVKFVNIVIKMFGRRVRFLKILFVH